MRRELFACGCGWSQCARQPWRSGRWRGNFWFRTDRGGKARGYAVVTYEPDSSVDGLNDAIGYVRDVAGAGIGALGPFAGGSFWLANRVD